jgi:molybdopterin-guanine dinucleotide biosynthesis protein A
MFDVEAFILVGGQSRRMGTDKSQLLFGEQTGVERIASALGPLTPTIKLVGSKDPSSALPNVPDLHKSWGALAGIYAALEGCGAAWSLIVACDLPLVTTELFNRLWQRAEDQAIDAIVPIQPDGRPQPLCAFYRRESCLTIAKALIAEGEHKPRALLAQVRTDWLSFDELADLPGANEFFLNVNTPDDYQQAQRVLLAAQPGQA